MRTLLSTLLLALALASTRADAQVAVQQGPTDQTEFKSPMILTAPFAMADPKAWTNDWSVVSEYNVFRKYRCDGVSIGTFRMRVKRLKDNKLQISFEPSLTNQVGHDKQVTVRLDLVNGDSEVGHVTLGPLQVDETDTKVRSVELTVPEASIQVSPPTSLRLTVTTRNI